MSTIGEYVRRQRAIPVNELSNDDTECICCRTVYGQLQAEGSIEYAVKLECLHIVGSNCLTKWLQYSKTCPHCRRQLSPQTPPTNDDEPDLAETMIGTFEARLLAEFEKHREPTKDECHERTLTGHWATRDCRTSDEQATQPWRYPAMRRRADVYLCNLYDDVRDDQVQAGVPKDDILPALKPWEMVSGALGWEADGAMFRHLQTTGAFSIPGMEPERRTPSDLSDEDYYEELRNVGADYNPARHGWFMHCTRVQFSTIHPNFSSEEREFNRLVLQRAFRTIGITRSFRDVKNLFPGEGRPTPTDYQIFQMTRKDGAHYRVDKMCWFNKRHDPLYGDVPRQPMTSFELLWEDRRTGRLTVRADADDDLLHFVDNLWIGERR